jgi:hypothetical protein
MESTCFWTSGTPSLATSFPVHGARNSRKRLCDHLLYAKFKTKSDDRAGIGYEGEIMTAEVSTKQNHRKFIPILARGRWVDGAPSWLIGKYYLDLIDVSRHEEGYQKLLATILEKLPQAPPLGSLSDAERLAATIVESMEDSDREAFLAAVYSLGDGEPDQSRAIAFVQPPKASRTSRTKTRGISLGRGRGG